MKILFLHLSDMHLKEDRGSNSIFDKIDNISALLSDYLITISIDFTFILFSGDIAFSGKSSQYTQAEDFFNCLKSKLTIKSLENLATIFIPGNHDCNFEHDSELRNISIKSVRDNYKQNAKLTVAQDVIEKCCEVQKEYFEFIHSNHKKLNTKYSYEVIYQDLLLNVVSFQFDKYSVGFKCLNTAWDSSISEVPGNKFFPLDLYKQLALPSADIVVAMMHHPYNWFSPDLARSLREVLEHKVDIIFTGHEHVSTGSTRTDILKNSTKYIEGAELQSSTATNSSGFNIFIVDLSRNLKLLSQCSWDGKQYVDSRTEWMPYNRKRALTKNIIRFSEKFQKEFLEDPGLQIIHPNSQEIHLDDIFQFPDVKLITPQSTVEDYKSSSNISSLELANLDDVGNKISIVGDQVSGKTSLCKALIKKYLDEGYYPIYLNEKSLRSPKFDQFLKLIDEEMKKQYRPENYETLKSLENNKKVIIIDNFDKLRLSSKNRINLLSQISHLFNNVIITQEDFLSIDNKIIESEMNEPVTNQFNEFRICPFGHLLRSRLIRKWENVGNDESIESSELDSRVGKVKRIIDDVIGKNFIPSYPIFLISILHLTESDEPISLNESSYAYYYQYLISRSLLKVIKKGEMDSYFTYLSCLAYRLYKEKQKQISYEEMKDFHVSHSRKYQLDLNLNNMMNDFKNSNTLIVVNEDIGFKYNYIYYYFISKYFSDHIEDEYIKSEIAQMCSKLHYEEYANILLFLTHHTKSSYVLGQVIKVAQSVFPDSFPITMDDDIQSINDLINEIPQLILRQRNVKDYQEEHYRERDEKEALRKEKDSPDQNDLEKEIQDAELSEHFNFAFRCIQILGQILKNHYGSIIGTDKYKLAKEAYLLGLRSLKTIVTSIEDNKNILINRAGTKESDKSTSVSQEEIKQALYRFYNMIFFVFITKISSDLGSDKLRETYRKIEEDLGYNSIKLINMAIKLDHFNIGIPFSDIEKLVRKVKHNRLSYDLLRQMVVFHIYLVETNEKHKQRISSMLDIDLDTRFNPESKKQIDI